MNELQKAGTVIEERSKTASPQVVLLGYPGVGKTTLALSLNGSAFEDTTATHGLDVLPLIEISKKEIRQSVSLLDLGPEGLQDIEKVEFSVALVVVDPSRDRVENDVKYWCDLLDARNDDPPPKRFLVASRMDIGGAVIGREGLNDLSRKCGFSGVFQTSAKDASGIQELRSAVIEASRTQEDETKHFETTVEILVRILADELCKLIAIKPQALDDIEWRDLERVIAAALKGIGFEVELTPASKDGGKDIIVNCIVGHEQHIFYVEIKHWRQGGRPGLNHVSDFIEVNAVDGTNGGLFVSSSGFPNEVRSRLSEISKQRVRLGDRNKIVSLCQKYVKSIEGLWQREVPLPEILFEETLQ